MQPVHCLTTASTFGQALTQVTHGDALSVVGKVEEESAPKYILHFIMAVSRHTDTARLFESGENHEEVRAVNIRTMY